MRAVVFFAVVFAVVALVSAGLPAGCKKPSCAKSHAECSSSQPCCDEKQECVLAHWLENPVTICLNKPPKCYGAFQRCAGAPGKPYVPYAKCCDDDHHCIEAEWAGWGRWCLPKPPKYYMAGERCAGARGKPYVPWASPPCEQGYECVAAPSKGYGKFCMKMDGTPTSAAAPTKSKKACRRRRRL